MSAAVPAVVCRCTPTCATRTETHAGLEFIIPTWCPTPQEWNSGGSWIDDDPDIVARVRAGIRQAFPGLETLRHASLLETPFDGRTCRTFWGSHGCDLNPGHGGLCVCVGCSAILKLGDDAGSAIAWWNDNLEPSVLHWSWY